MLKIKSGWLQSIFTHSKWYLLASLATKALGFVLLPIYTRYLTPTDYGLLTSFEVINNILPLFFSFALDRAFDRFYHQPTASENYLRQLFSALFWFILVLGTIAVTVLIISSYYWLPFFMEVPAYPYAYLAFIPSLLMEISLLGFSFFRQSLRAKNMSIILIGSACLNAILSLYLIIEGDLGVIGRLWGNLAGAFCSFACVLIYINHKNLLSFSINRPLLKKCLHYSIPLIPLIASNWINIFSDRLIIGKYVNLEAVGIYSIAFHISMIAYFIGESIVQVLAPISMKGLETNKAHTKQRINDYTLYLWLFLWYGSIFLYFFSQDLIDLFLADSFRATAILLPLFCTAIIFQIIHRLYGQLIKFHQQTKIYTLGAISSSTLNLLLNFCFVPTWGYIAAVYTTLFVNFLYAAFIIWRSQLLEPTAIPYRPYLFSSLLFIFCILLSFQIFFTLWWRILVFIILGGCLLWWGFTIKKDR